ncbi:MAG TPA: TetR/AcrR family transcriptional regulator [Gammaproteobacteria bacterium]|nr:TetR/AcrR family transcriptional regulator [Gammaproteobacteria bacterium]
MGRTKTFDESVALGLAMRLFWRQGYANTSLKQLLAEMDMLNGSFYHCFKDKKTIFLRSLEHYNQEITHNRQQALISHDDFSTGIRALFSDIFKTLESRDEPDGCLIVNSMVNEVLCEKELKAFLYDDFRKFVQFMTDRVQLSIDLKHTSTLLPAKQLAFILVTYIQGLFRISNTYVDVTQLKNQTNDFLLAFNL